MQEELEISFHSIYIQVRFHSNYMQNMVDRVSNKKQGKRTNTYSSAYLKAKGQFHQHFMSSFYARKSQKCKKDSQLKQFFALSGSVGVKAACKHVDEIDPWWIRGKFSLL